MNKKKLYEQIQNCHAEGKKIAVFFCSHVPQEILEATGICAVRVPVIQEFVDTFPGILPKNVCPSVRSCCALCEDGVLDEADMIITESSCDGKKKMYELLHCQEKLYYYQVAQGIDREYSKPLIVSEIKYLIHTIEIQFGVKITKEKLKQAADRLNEERKSITSLMDIQKECPPPVTGMDVYRELEKNRAIFDRVSRTQANKDSAERLKNKQTDISNERRRILITGCPLGGVFPKVLRAVEENDGVVVCFENCEVMKAGVRYVNTAAEDIIDAIAECYLNTSCAIMAPNPRRFELLETLVDEYHVDGVLDVSLQTCHPYSVEKYKIQRFLKNLGVPCLSIETSDTDSDVGQLTTRISAFIEML